MLGKIAIALMGISQSWQKYSAASIMLPHALFHPIVTFILMNLFAAAFRLDSTAVFGPSTFYLLIGIQFRLRRIIEEPIVHIRLIAFVIAFLLMCVLSPPRHLHHAAILPKLALHQFFGITAVIVIANRRGCETIADIVYTLKSVFIDAIPLVSDALRRLHSYPASCRKVRATYQRIVMIIGRHIFFSQLSKITSRLVKRSQMLWYQYRAS